MTFSILLYEEILFDMRAVPFIIGALYGGRRVAFTLFIVMFSYHYYLGHFTNVYICLIVYTLLLIILLYLIPHFQSAKTVKKRILIAFVPSLFGGMIFLNMLYMVNGLDWSGLELLSLLVLYGTQAAGILLFVTYIERTRNDKFMLEELKRLEKLKVVSEIAASISHEVRNPLTVTRGFLQLLKDPNLVREKREMYIELSTTELDRAAATISDYLTFAKPSIKNTEILDLNTELEYVKKVVMPYATLHNVELFLINTKDKEIFIFGERQKLHQCLINITKNGIEAMSNGGQLTLQLEQKNALAIVKIQDTGIGMNREQINRLGTPYYSTKDKGTGLGTMVVFSIVKIMNGNISVESKVGKGTSFILSFPLVKNSAITIDKC